MNLSKKLNIALPVLLSLCGVHFINDLLQATVAATYPLIKDDLNLTFAQIGAITFVYQIAGSIFQPAVGFFFDKRPFKGSIAIATAFTMFGIMGLSFAPSLFWVFISVFIVGVGSSIIHPEASRITSLASGGKRGLAQSIFQVGGNFGGSVGPLLIAVIVSPYGRGNLLWFIILSAISFAITRHIGRWYKGYLNEHGNNSKSAGYKARPLGLGATVTVIVLICILIISKYIYLEGLKSYYTFYLIEKFNVSIQASQLLLFVFLFATAAGTLLGGPIGDKIGRKWVILLSIVGTAPFSLAMPYVGLAATAVLSFCSGFILSSAFPAILVYAQELLPNRLGLISGIFFGFAFGVGGIISAILGSQIDIHGIEPVYKAISYSPLIGLVAVFLPKLKG